VSERGEPNQPVDDGAAIHYSAVAPGTAVFSSDGVVFTDSGGTQRFADAPEVARTAERGVTLELTAEQAMELGPPEKRTGSPPGAGGAGALGRLFGRRRG
jgi:hypothetical protein